MDLCVYSSMVDSSMVDGSMVDGSMVDVFSRVGVFSFSGQSMYNV